MFSNYIELKIISVIVVYFTLNCNLSAQSIDWTRVYHDDYGRPLYTGGTSYSSPTFVDIDGDGDYDYFQGCEIGTIWFFENIGTPDSAVWQLVIEKYNDIEFDYLKYSNVTFADIDGDWDMDMFLGGWMEDQSKGIHFYQNVGDQYNPVWNFVTDKYQNIQTNQGISFNYCKTAFVDLDNDADLDLLFGNSSRDIYYKNIGDPTNPIFQFESDDYFGFGYTYGGFHRPVLLDIDNDNDYDCFIGTGQYSYFFLYVENIGTANSAIWNLVSDNYNGISDSDLFAEFCDIDSDGDYDMFVGMHDGRIYYYENITTTNEPIWQFRTNNPITLDVGFFSYPSFCDIDSDGLPEMFITNHIDYSYQPASIWFYENFGTPASPYWQLDTTAYFNIQQPNLSAPAFVDIDSDNDLDFFLGIYDPEIIYYENTGDASNPQFDSIGVTEFNFDPQSNVVFRPALVDIDADGDLDMFICAEESLVPYGPILIYYRNDGTPSLPVWTHVYTAGAPYGTVAFMDEDNDGDYDMFIGSWGDDTWGDIHFFRNIGDKFNPNFQWETEHYANISVGEFNQAKFIRTHYNITFSDIERDGDLDLIIGERDGGINLFRNDGLVGFNEPRRENKPDNFKLYQNYPNPFNPLTTIKYQLPKSSKVTLEIFNILGQKVITLVDEQQGVDYYKIYWKGINNSGNKVGSGIYIYRIIVEANDGSENFVNTKKMIIIK